MVLNAINLLKREIYLFKKSSSYLTENILRLHYEDQQVNIV
jgi:hypothetical protein